MKPTEKMIKEQVRKILHGINIREKEDDSSIPVCRNFGCGKRLSLFESLCGDRCIGCSEGGMTVRNVKTLPIPDRPLWDLKLISREKDYKYQFNGDEDLIILPRYKRKKLLWRVSDKERILVHRLTNDEFDTIRDFLKSLSVDYNNNEAFRNWREVFEQERLIRIKKLGKI